MLPLLSFPCTMQPCPSPAPRPPPGPAPGPRSPRRSSAEARRQLAEVGTDLSLRAVARALGMASSAVYRYFASRDELLTALIVETYDTVGEAAERAAAGARAHRRSAMDGARRRDPQLGIRPSPRLLAGLRQPGPRLPSACGHHRAGRAGEPGGAADHPRRRGVRGDHHNRFGANAHGGSGRPHPHQRPCRARPAAGRRSPAGWSSGRTSSARSASSSSVTSTT